MKCWGRRKGVGEEHPPLFSYKGKGSKMAYVLLLNVRWGFYVAVSWLWVGPRLLGKGPKNYTSFFSLFFCSQKSAPSDSFCSVPFPLPSLVTPLVSESAKWLIIVQEVRDVDFLFSFYTESLLFPFSLEIPLQGIVYCKNVIQSHVLLDYNK